jgi:DegV family protein with EDD domain
MLAQSMMQEQNPDVHGEVIDTRNVSLCQGWMAIEAARAALAGLKLEEVADKVKSMIPVSHMIQTADTLKYLYMGGRIGRAKQMVGTLLNIKPLIGMEDGEIVPEGMARSRGQAYQAMVDKVEETVGKSRIKIAYVHAGARQEVEKLRKAVETRLNTVESLIAELSPALAVHTGPGTAGLCYFPTK